MLGFSIKLTLLIASFLVIESVDYIVFTKCDGKPLISYTDTETPQSDDKNSDSSEQENEEKSEDEKEKKIKVNISLTFSISDKIVNNYPNSKMKSTQYTDKQKRPPRVVA